MQDITDLKLQFWWENFTRSTRGIVNRQLRYWI